MPKQDNTDARGVPYQNSEEEFLRDYDKWERAYMPERPPSPKPTLYYEGCTRYHPGQGCTDRCKGKREDPYEQTPYTPFGAYGPTPEEASRWHIVFLIFGIIIGVIVTLCLIS